MEASAGLVAGSHNRNELVVIRRDGEPGVRLSRSLARRRCPPYTWLARRALVSAAEPTPRGFGPPGC
jgi:hypothetical protein